ncbi:MAG TPA: hypothetical protein VE083_00140 [Terriglobales bacterium]|nr:hypothetical protein [Terriglobales bacterium]
MRSRYDAPMVVTFLFAGFGLGALLALALLALDTARILATAG